MRGTGVTAGYGLAAGRAIGGGLRVRGRATVGPPLQAARGLKRVYGTTYT